MGDGKECINMPEREKDRDRERERGRERTKIPLKEN
jgi:hypothetical protein